MEAKIISCTAWQLWRHYQAILTENPLLSFMYSILDNPISISKSGTNCGIATFLKLVRWQDIQCINQDCKTSRSGTNYRTLIFCTDCESYRSTTTPKSNFYQEFLDTLKMVLKFFKHPKKYFWNFWRHTKNSNLLVSI